MLVWLGCEGEREDGQTVGRLGLRKMSSVVTSTRSTRDEGGTRRRRRRRKKRSSKRKRVQISWSGAKRAIDVERCGRKARRTKTRKKGGAVSSTTFSSTSESLAVIAAYHTAEKRLKQLVTDRSISAEERERKRTEIEQEKRRLGGLETYQRASMYGAASSGYTCSRSIVPLIKKHLPRRHDDNTKPFVLDIGAIDHQYEDFESQLVVLPIDLNPQHEKVVRADFFNFAREMIQTQRVPTCATSVLCEDRLHQSHFDVVIMSLVLNFVGDPRERGQMLALASRLMRVGGLLFVSLPSACLANSRYMDNDRFQGLVCSLGYEVVNVSISKKIYLGTFRLRKAFETYDASRGTFRFKNEFRRVHLRRGDKRNNFCVMLKSDSH